MNYHSAVLARVSDELYEFIIFLPRYFFTYLLPHQAPPMVKPLIHQIMNSTGEFSCEIHLDELNLAITAKVAV